MVARGLFSIVGWVIWVSCVGSLLLSWLGWGCVGCSAICWLGSVSLGGSELLVQSAGVRIGVVSSLCSSGAVCVLVGVWLGGVCWWVGVGCSMGEAGSLGVLWCGSVCWVVVWVGDGTGASGAVGAVFDVPTLVSVAVTRWVGCVGVALARLCGGECGLGVGRPEGVTAVKGCGVCCACSGWLECVGV